MDGGFDDGFVGELNAAEIASMLDDAAGGVEYMDADSRYVGSLNKPIISLMEYSAIASRKVL